MALNSIWARIRGSSGPPSLTRTTMLNLIGFATWIPVIAWFNLHVAELTVIDGSSMYPFMNADRDSSLRRDVVLNYKWSPQEDLQRGMIVTLRSPFHPETIAVKRVVALEGDVVKTKQPYPVSTVKIPQGHVWVEGDGPPGSSLDSNTYGPVSKRLLTGRVTHIVYPPKKFGPAKSSPPNRTPSTRQFAGTPQRIYKTCVAEPKPAYHLAHSKKFSERRSGAHATDLLSQGEIISKLRSCFLLRWWFFLFGGPFLSLYLFVFFSFRIDKPSVSIGRRFLQMSEGLSTSSQFPLAGFNSATTTPESAATSDSTTITTTTTTTAAAGRDVTALDSSRYAGHHSIVSSESHTAGGLAKPAHTMHGEDVEVEGRPPYIHAMIAGGIGGSTGDMLMHSLDTVKTRQQGDPHFPPKYTSLGRSYHTIWRQEGIARGLYGGWIPALGGSFPGTLMFFGTYEWSKRFLIDHGLQHHLAYLSAGFLGDLAASIVYVPSEVLKTRLQLQGRYNNPHFVSGYNYRSTLDAARTIVRSEGASALFHGYKATLYRDLPFSALQFMFWEQFQAWSRVYKQSRDIGAPLELLTGAAAGGLAGVITCPLDVVKTRLQTQVNIPSEPESSHHESSHRPKDPNPQKRSISTSSPSTHRPKPGAIALNTSSVFAGLRVIYHTEGLGGWFRGVGPRGVWTFIQSGCMLFLYQRLLHKLEVWMPLEDSKVETAL